MTSKGNVPSKPVLILFNGDEALAGGLDSEAVLGVRDSVHAIESALRNAGQKVLSVPVTDMSDMLVAVSAQPPRLVINLVESINGRGEHEAAACGVLDLLGVPYTGSGPLTLAASQNKPLTKSVLRGLGLKTADWCVLKKEDVRGDDASGLLELMRKNVDFPCIVKPCTTDGSHGIDPGSVVNDAVAALERAAYLWDRYGCEVLVENYIAGREVNVAIVGNGPTAQVLPLSEIVFRTPEGVPPIVTYGAKWVEGSDEWGDSEVACPAPIQRRLTQRIEKLALETYHAVGCRDYARVDMRICEDGLPHVIEVNPNPDLAPDAGFARSARVFGWSYDDLIHAIVRTAETRLGIAKTPPSIGLLGHQRPARANRGVLTGRSRLRAVTH